jgi:hypothetical protein
MASGYFLLSCIGGEKDAPKLESPINYPLRGGIGFPENFYIQSGSRKIIRDSATAGNLHPKPIVILKNHSSDPNILLGQRLIIFLFRSRLHRLPRWGLFPWSGKTGLRNRSIGLWSLGQRIDFIDLDHPNRSHADEI